MFANTNILHTNTSLSYVSLCGLGCVWLGCYGYIIYLMTDLISSRITLRMTLVWLYGLHLNLKWLVALSFFIHVHSSTRNITVSSINIYSYILFRFLC